MESDATLESAFKQELSRRAKVYYQQAYSRQMQGAVDEAIALYQQSLEMLPTAEAHTFLGWAYSFQGRFDEAISECRQAITVDPDFGNPYNDIGAYLIELGRPQDALETLHRALAASRYDCYHYAHFNLGRVYEAADELEQARHHYARALDLAPGYHPAAQALDLLQPRLVPMAPDGNA